jgi:hypothetical protein
MGAIYHAYSLAFFLFLSVFAVNDVVPRVETKRRVLCSAPPLPFFLYSFANFIFPDHNEQAFFVSSTL